jgi:hypothetical protein
VSTDLQPILRPAHRWDDVRVLREYELRDGYDLAETSRFADDVWILTPAVHQQHSRGLTLWFTTMPERYRLLAKEVLCAFMAMPLPAGEERLSIRSIRTQFCELKRLFTWLDERPVPPWLAELTGHDAADYARFVRSKLRNGVSAARSRATVRRIWRFRSVLPSDRLLFDPQHVDGWSQPGSYLRGENRTDRIPEAVLAPLVVWAMRFVDVFAADILAMVSEWAQLRRNDASVPKAQGKKRPDLQSALQELLARHLQEGRPLPGRKGVVNYSFLGKVLTCSRSSLDRTPAYIEQIEAAAKVVGIDEETFFYTPTTAWLDDELWLEKISNEAGHRSLPVLSRLLQTACYILISFLSGMRDSEIKHLNRGCLRIERDANGVPYRWKVHGRAFKGERDQRGVPAVWVVGQPAARAIEVLEALQPAGTDILFQVLPYGTGWADEHAGRALTSSITNLWLNRFVGWVNDFCRSRGRLDRIPEVAGAPWRLKNIQFRRTLAWFIARKPGGAVAGAIQYRHMSVHMFEGYAGTSESGFRAEVESEQALARGEHLVEMVDTRRHENLAGPGAEEAARRLEEFGLHTAGFGGNVVTDERRLRRLMKRHDPAIYPGTYVTCVYSHEKALCRRTSDSAGNALPQLGDCKPLACRNVALSGDNIGVWRGEIDRIDEKLAHRPRLPPVLEHRLHERRTEIAAFLARYVGQEPQ